MDKQCTCDCHDSLANQEFSQEIQTLKLGPMSDQDFFSAVIKVIPPPKRAEIFPGPDPEALTRAVVALAVHIPRVDLHPLQLKVISCKTQPMFADFLRNYWQETPKLSPSDVISARALLDQHVAQCEQSNIFVRPVPQEWTHRWALSHHLAYFMMRFTGQATEMGNFLGLSTTKELADVAFGALGVHLRLLETGGLGPEFIDWASMSFSSQCKWYEAFFEVPMGSHIDAIPDFSVKRTVKALAKEVDEDAEDIYEGIQDQKLREDIAWFDQFLSLLGRKESDYEGTNQRFAAATSLSHRFTEAGDVESYDPSGSFTQ
ncbi:hypothetical protein BJ170DRAFT_624567 [Xylariales sp. AK1849]|nr:hypothetical protein BJ170DRAFT_624567 [Xylariales sp. AK1849]